MRKGNILLMTLLALLTIPRLSLGANSFMCTKGMFQQNEEENGDECVLYVRFETEIPWSACNGSAYTCFQKAQDAGYAVGSEPRESAIIVFNTSGGLPDGHVGIVKSINGSTLTIRDSNWNNDHIIHEHPVSSSRGDIEGYIYCDGRTGPSYHEQTTTCAGNICWEPKTASCEGANSWYILKEIPYAERSSSSICSSKYQQIETIAPATNPSQQVPEDHWWQAWWRKLRSVLGETASASEIRQFTVERTLAILDSQQSWAASGNGIIVLDATGYGMKLLPTDVLQSSPPDFIVNKIWLETVGGTEQYAYNKTDEIKMKAQFKNVGTGSISGSSMIESRFYLSKGYKEDSHNEWIRVGTDETQGDNLDPWETHTETEGLKLWEYSEIKPGKVYNIIACVDRIADQYNGSGDYSEKHESNNCSTEAVFTVNGVFNFTITQLALGGGKTQLNIGETFNLDTTAYNAGANNASGDTRIGYYLSGGSLSNELLIGTSSVKEENFAAGISKTETLSNAVAPVIPGTYTFKACTDFDNRVSETNENDNCHSIQVEVVSPFLPGPKKASPAVRHLLYNN